MGVNSDVLDDNAALCPTEKTQMLSGFWKMLDLFPNWLNTVGISFSFSFLPKCPRGGER